MKLFTYKFTDSKIAKFQCKKLSYKVIMFSLLSFISFIADAQTGVFSWYNGSVGQTWAATDVSKSYTISCGTGCTVTVTMTIIDPNHRNSSPTTYNYNPFDSGNGCLPYPGVAQTDNVSGNGSILDPWDSDCAPFYTQTGGAYGTNFLTFAMNSATHLEDVTIRYTFSKPVFLDAFTVGDIDGRTMQQDRDANQSGSLSVYELPGNSYQDEVTVSALGPNGSVGVNYSALGTLLFQTGQTVRSVYNANTTNLNPDDARGTITVNTNDAITQLDITYSNGPDDAAAEQANPTWYSWWVNGGTFTLSDGRVVTQPAQGTTNGASDNHAIRISGFTFTACPDFDFTRTNATVCVGETATIGVVPANGTSPYTYSWSGPNGYTSSAQNPSITNITAAQAGTYTVTAYDANGCTGTTTAQITVNSLPIAGITGASNLSCTTTSVERTATGGGTYLWSNGLGTSATVNITSAGTYTVTVTDLANGCSSTATTVVTIDTTVPTPSINGSSNLTCTITSVERTATGGGTYLWSNGLGTSATVNITSAGTYTVTVTDLANGCSSTATTVVIINNTPPIAGITGTDNLSCSGGLADRIATGGGTYLWNGPNSYSSTSASIVLSLPGTYTVTVTDPANGCTATATTTVIVEPCGSIGDYVWIDTDTDGQQDSGEPVISGVKVYLLNASGVKLDSTLTDGSGKYLFDSLLSGSYRVQFVAPSGTIASKSNIGSDVTDSDANASGLSHLIGIDTSRPEGDSLRNNLNIDAGFVPVGSIGDYVFQDKDNSGTQTAGDLPVSGVKVYLLDATTGAKLDSTITDLNGLYKFDSLLSGNYKIQVEVPTGMSPVTKDSGSDDAKDSDIDPTGITGVVTIDTTKPVGDPLRNNTSIDAGVKITTIDCKPTACVPYVVKKIKAKV